MPNFDETYFSNLLEETRAKCKAAVELPQNEIILELFSQYPLKCKEVQDANNAVAKAEKQQDAQEIIDSFKETAKVKQEEKEAFYEEILAILEPILQDFHLYKSPELKRNLMKCAVLNQSTPKGLAEYCQAHGPEMFLELMDPSCEELLEEMLVHGGPGTCAPGKFLPSNWCRALQLYKYDLLPLIFDEHDAYAQCHKRLAMAVALQHSNPISYFDQDDVYIDPIARFQHYVKAHRNGELDPAFGYFTTWEYRMIVDCNAQEEQLQWGRDQLKRYRPDLIDSNMGMWRYTMQVKTDVGYRTPNWTSRPKTYQQLVSGGGRCGPRAWYGRFICKAHGIPTWGVRQPAHAAMGKWTRGGWGTLLGSAWQYSSWEAREGSTFVDEANARAFQKDNLKEYFQKLTLLECMAEVYDERNLKKAELARFHSKWPWRSLVIAQRLLWSKQVKGKHFQRGPGFDVPDHVFPCCHQDVMARQDSPKDDSNREVKTLESDGTIIIPACSFSSEKAVKTSKCYEGGFQIHMQEKSKLEFVLPKEVPVNDYELTFQVCTVHLEHEKEPLCLQINKSKEKLDIQVPYTVGDWGYTSPIKLELGKGDVLKISRTGEKKFGLTMKCLILKPSWVLV